MYDRFKYADFLFKQFLRPNTRSAENGTFVISKAFDGIPGRYGEAGERSLGVQLHDATFYIDGNYGLALGYKAPSKDIPVWLAVMSISHGVDIWGYSSRQDPLAQDGAPIIVQLQGPSLAWTYTDKGRHRAAAHLLQTIDWERALVSLCLPWAEDTCETLYMLPAELNMHKNKPEVTFGRLRRRYDFTASSSGFVKLSEDPRSLLVYHPQIK